jgi:hypothetical protein
MPIDFFGGEEQFKYTTTCDKIKHDLCIANCVKIFYYSDEKIDNYELGRVYNDFDELLNVITHKT